MSNSIFLSQPEQELVEIDRRLLAIINRYQYVEQRFEEHQEGPLVDVIRSRLHALEKEHDEFRQSLHARNLLPHAPDSDLEDLKRVAASIRAWIEDDQAQALLTWLIETEQDWQEALSTFESSEIQREEIERLRHSAQAAIKRLKDQADPET